jgi:hypothetical protein
MLNTRNVHRWWVAPAVTVLGLYTILGLAWIALWAPPIRAREPGAMWDTIYFTDHTLPWSLLLVFTAAALYAGWRAPRRWAIGAVGLAAGTAVLALGIVLGIGRALWPMMEFGCIRGAFDTVCLGPLPVATNGIWAVLHGVLLGVMAAGAAMALAALSRFVWRRRHGGRPAA